MATKSSDSKNYKIEDYSIQKEPFYIPVSDEVQVFESAYNQKVPILLKGPTGTGKTRFVEYMSWYISNNVKKSVPLITVACHEDLTASDLVGRYLIDSAGTKWIDGPLTRAVKSGGICYLDEIVEARKDTTVIVHPLTDHRRILTIDKLGEVVEAADGFLMVVSYNPGYQNALKDLKQSTRQRFVAIEFDFPTPELEAKVLKEEGILSNESYLQVIFSTKEIGNISKVLPIVNEEKKAIILLNIIYHYISDIKTAGSFIKIGSEEFYVC